MSDTKLLEALATENAVKEDQFRLSLKTTAPITDAVSLIRSFKQISAGHLDAIYFTQPWSRASADAVHRAGVYAKKIVVIGEKLKPGDAEKDVETTEQTPSAYFKSLKGAAKPPEAKRSLAWVETDGRMLGPTDVFEYGIEAGMTLSESLENCPCGFILLNALCHLTAVSKDGDPSGKIRYKLTMPEASRIAALGYEQMGCPETDTLGRRLCFLFKRRSAPTAQS